MKHFIATAVMVSSLLFGPNVLAALSSIAQKESSPGQSDGTFKYSTGSKIVAEQKNVYDTIIKYQNALDTGDTKIILGLFADESYSQWNDKLTVDNTEKCQGQYDDLLKREEFETDFAFGSTWINGNTAVVRTHYHAGPVVTNSKEQKTITGLNREVLAFSKIDGEWKVSLYTFNTNPFQGVV